MIHLNSQNGKNRVFKLLVGDVHVTYMLYATLSSCRWEAPMCDNWTSISIIYARIMTIKTALALLRRAVKKQEKMIDWLIV